MKQQCDISELLSCARTCAKLSWLRVLSFNPHNTVPNHKRTEARVRTLCLPRDEVL